LLHRHRSIRLAYKLFITKHCYTDIGVLGWRTSYLLNSLLNGQLSVPKVEHRLCRSCTKLALWQKLCDCGKASELHSTRSQFSGGTNKSLFEVPMTFDYFGYAHRPYLLSFSTKGKYTVIQKKGGSLYLTITLANLSITTICSTPEMKEDTRAVLTTVACRISS